MQLSGKAQELTASARVHGDQDISERHSTHGLLVKAAFSTPWWGLPLPTPHQRGPEHSISNAVQDINFVCSHGVGLAGGILIELEGARTQHQCPCPRRPKHAKHSSTHQLWGASCLCQVRVQFGNGCCGRAWSARITRNSGFGRNYLCVQK